MRIRYKKLIQMEVLANREGRLLGSVRRVMLDSKKRAVQGLVFRGKLLSGEHWSPTSKVERVGEDVVFLVDLDAVREDEPAGRDTRDILGLPVNTLEGKNLGDAIDLYFNTDSWQIEAITLSTQGAVPIGGEAVFGEDVILLRAGAEEELTKDIEEPGGFLARVFPTDAESNPTSTSSSAKKTSRAPKRSPEEEGDDV